MAEARKTKSPQPLDAETLSTASFESILERLEAVVEKLEKGNLSLDESLRVFEEGVQLSRMGSRRLEEAEHKVEILVNPQGSRDEPSRMPFVHNGEEA